MKMKIEWKDMELDGPPEPGKDCFVEVNGYLQVAYWTDFLIPDWNNHIYGWFPKSYDDSGGVYSKKVTKWAYVPKDFLNTEVVFKNEENHLCSCFKPNYFGTEKDYCLGTKNFEVCHCDGDESKCDFY